MLDNGADVYLRSREMAKDIHSCGSYKACQMAVAVRRNDKNPFVSCLAVSFRGMEQIPHCDKVFPRFHAGKMTMTMTNGINLCRGGCLRLKRLGLHLREMVVKFMSTWLKDLCCMLILQQFLKELTQMSHLCTCYLNYMRNSSASTSSSQQTQQKTATCFSQFSFTMNFSPQNSQHTVWGSEKSISGILTQQSECFPPTTALAEEEADMLLTQQQSYIELCTT